MKWQATVVFEKLWEAIQEAENGERKYNIICLEGGSRSSKTVSIIQAIYLLAVTKKWRITALRKERTTVRKTVFFDFKEYLQSVEAWSEDAMNYSNFVYDVGSTIEFDGVDDKQKLHGRKQNLAWINEAIEIEKADFDQIEQRTSDLIIMDWNPTEVEHWLFDLQSRKDVKFIHSTVFDNPFVPPNVLRKIRGYEPTPENIAQKTADEFMWTVYGLGKRAVRDGAIFKNWSRGAFDNSLPFVYGQDFGFSSDPTTLVKVAVDKKLKKVYVKQIYGEPGLTTSGIYERNKMERGLIVADSAEPRLIFELKSKGLNIISCRKGPDSVRFGILNMMEYEIIVDDSPDIERELRLYQWSDKRAGVPVDKDNHYIDAIRYGFDKLTYVGSTAGISH